ncbi:uncharacterized protein LOC135502994 isoform X3 [Lineus longissimus]|uniref:uncharacterized protein LOC135502994 isoform X3 n=1 Tax=Lineus longissimus TaxID=88925 RepID=UPI00315D4E4B
MRLNTYSIVPCAILFIQATTFATGLVSTTYNDEKQAQAVTVSFYQLRPSTWTDTGLVNKFKNAIATAVNTYCRANLSQCGLNATIDFLGANVFINSDPIQRNSYLDVTFHVKYPDGVQLTSTASTNFVLPKTILEAITATARARVKLSLGYEIVKIGDVIYYKSPDDRLNMILIPISCCLLLVVIIVAIALHCWSEARRSSEKRKRKRDQEHANKKKAHAADKAKLNEKKRKSPKVGPSPSDTPAKSKFGKHKENGGIEPRVTLTAPVSDRQLSRAQVSPETQGSKADILIVNEDSGKPQVLSVAEGSPNVDTLTVNEVKQDGKHSPESLRDSPGLRDNLALPEAADLKEAEGTQEAAVQQGSADMQNTDLQMSTESADLQKANDLRGSADLKGDVEWHESTVSGGTVRENDLSETVTSKTAVEA